MSMSGVVLVGMCFGGLFGGWNIAVDMPIILIMRMADRCARMNKNLTVNPKVHSLRELVAQATCLHRNRGSCRLEACAT